LSSLLFQDQDFKIKTLNYKPKKKHSHGSRITTDQELKIRAHPRKSVAKI